MNAKELHIISGWFAEGKIVERISIDHEWKKFTWHDLIQDFNCDFSDLRLKHAPVKRFVRVEELPFPCAVGTSQKCWQTVSARSKDKIFIDHYGWIEINEKTTGCRKYTNDPRKPFDQWNSFEVEDKQ